MTDLSTLIGGVIAQAAATPRETGATAKYAKRRQSAGSATVILADCSASMLESAGSRAKIQLLQDALDQVRPDMPDAALIAFSSMPVLIDSGWHLPRPDGGTDLAEALNRAARERPARTLVISDGQPDDARAALAAADRLSGRIDVIYVGPDGDDRAIAFMRDLARTGGGRCVVNDLTRSLQPPLQTAVRDVLALPAPRGSGS